MLLGGMVKYKLILTINGSPWQKDFFPTTGKGKTRIWPKIVVNPDKPVSNIYILLSGYVCLQVYGSNAP